MRYLGSALLVYRKRNGQNFKKESNRVDNCYHHRPSFNYYAAIQYLHSSMVYANRLSGAEITTAILMLKSGIGKPGLDYLSEYVEVR